MRQNPSFTLASAGEIKRLVRENPWGTIVSSTSNGLVASHYPFVLEETAAASAEATAAAGAAASVAAKAETAEGSAEASAAGSAAEIVLLSHLGRPDELLHELGEHELMVIFQGPHGYISPGWYQGGPAVPTWNFVTAHLYGVPEILSDEENYRVLAALTDHFEDRMPEPFRMERDPENVAYAQRLYQGTVGIRLRVTRFVAKSKLSQNRSPEAVARILTELETGAQYPNPTLAAEMRRFWTSDKLP